MHACTIINYNYNILDNLQFNKCSVECNGTHTGCTNPDTHDPWIHPQCTVDCEVSGKGKKMIIILAVADSLLL